MIATAMAGLAAATHAQTSGQYDLRWIAAEHLVESSGGGYALVGEVSQPLSYGESAGGIYSVSGVLAVAEGPPPLAGAAAGVRDYLVGRKADPSGLDVNSDSAVDIADLIQAMLNQ